MAGPSDDTFGDADIDHALSGLDADRRRFIKRVVATSAVAVPVVSTFSLSGLTPSFNTAFGASGGTTPPTTAPNSTP
jgi:hypothetical protein